MKTHSSAIAFLSALTFLAMMAGCGNDGIAPVSGTVTHNGQPVANVFVVFNPKATGDNHFPGPFSTGITDANGKYRLRTRKGSNGAVIGPHSVGFTWSDVSPIEMALLQEELVAASMAENPEAARAEAEQRIKETKEKMKSRPALGPPRNLDFEVPSGGTSTANFDLGK